ncbi:general stress protein A [Methanobrevibacter cuticularis]|uniref:General stress protein A n=1 Tax=Methanobrevibacter cuticularis TaxID=47311 RepID=A0A166DXW0_9EURY|nr:glycosyltransferase family 8 protein [Methanobrevibacter cuticularis]KZX16069.1 general stress protein A [Methanobrevibacter cuticularis]
MKSGELHVIYISGNDFMPYAGVSIESLFENNKTFSEIYLHLFDRGIDNSNKEKLEALCKKYNRKLFLYDINEKMYDKILNNKTMQKINLITSINTLSKLLIPQIIPKDIEKIIYIDADSLVLGSLENLWNMDITNYYFAAVEDLAVLSMFPQIKTSLGLDNNSNYVNAGIMFINLTKWKEDNVEEKFIDFLGDYDSFFMDQDVFNKVLFDKILIIPLNYNVLPAFYGFSYDYFKYSKLESYYSENEIKDALENPIIFHFARSNIVPRPWYSGELFKLGNWVNKKKLIRISPAYKDFITSYSNSSESSIWKDEVYIKDERSFIGRLSYILTAIIPFFSIMLIFIYKKL